MKYPYALFDMDGTMLDSMSCWRSVDQKYLESRGVSVPADFREKIGPLTFEQRAVYFREQMGITESPEEIVLGMYEIMREMYEKDVQVKPGLMDFLKELKARGVRMGVVTATDTVLSVPVLERFGILDYMEFVMDCREVGGKNSPAVYDAAAKRLGGDRSNTLIFEDALHAVRTAAKAGYCLAVVEEPLMSRGKTELLALADIYIEDYRTTDFWEWWEKNGKKE